MTITRSLSRAVAAGLVVMPMVPAMPSAAQQADLPLVAINAASGQAGFAEAVDGFLLGMRELGYFEGRNVRYEYRFAEGDTALIEPYARELVAMNPAVIVTLGPVTVPTLVQLTKTIPIVVGFASQTQMSELVQNFDQPEGNVTGRMTQGAGFNNNVPGLARELLPAATRLGYLGGDLEAFSNVAAPLGLTAVGYDPETLEDAVAAFEALIAEGVDVIAVAGTVSTISASPQLGRIALEAGMPAIFGPVVAVREGGLIRFGGPANTAVKTSAYLVDRILRGDAPGELPIYHVGGSEHIVVNLGAAEQMGFTVPASVIARATEILD